MWFIGIDPGQKGAIGIINEFRQGLILPMPDGERAIRETLANIVLEYAGTERPTKTAIFGLEAVHAFPTIDKKSGKVMRGAASTWTFGRHYGFLRGVLTTLDIAFEDVTCHEWMKECHVPPRGPRFGRKPGLYRAKLWFPHLNPKNDTADAVLIAEFLRRRNCSYDAYASEVAPSTDSISP